MIPLRLPHLLLIVVALLTGCATPRPEATPKPAVTKPKIGLALGGGAARGFAHIGVVKMLEARHCP